MTRRPYTADEVAALAQEAGCREEYVTIARMRWSGMTQTAIAEAVGTTQPGVCRALKVIIRRVGKHLALEATREQVERDSRHEYPGEFGGELEFHRWTGRTIHGDIREDGPLGGWRPPTIGSSRPPEPKCDDRGNPVSVRARVWRAEDMLAPDR